MAAGLPWMPWHRWGAARRLQYRPIRPPAGFEFESSFPPNVAVSVRFWRWRKKWRAPCVQGVAQTGRLRNAPVSQPPKTPRGRRFCHLLPHRATPCQSGVAPRVGFVTTDLFIGKNGGSEAGRLIIRLTRQVREVRTKPQGVAAGNPRVAPGITPPTIGHLVALQSQLLPSVPKMIQSPDGTSRPRARPTATDSGGRVLPNGGGQRAGTRVATHAGSRRPKDRRGGH